MSDTPASPQVLVTRPEREAAGWVRALQAQGITAQALPLIAILPALDTQALAVRRADLAGDRAAMFVSANAVRGFLPGGDADRAPWPAGTRAWATGPGTRQALIDAGVPASQVDAPPADAAQFDSETLWPLVRGQLQPGDRVLIVRGGDAQGAPAGRDWLARQLADAGARVDAVAAYRRGLPAWDEPRRDLARAALAAGSWWLFSSSEAVANLVALLPGADLSRARAACTHPRIAGAAAAAGFGQVAEVAPVPAAVIAFLQSQP